MTMRFNELKATQAAAYLIRLRGQGYMSYMKLIKLLYFADREALLRWGSPITADTFYSMNRGPVLSRIHDLVTEGAAPTECHFWEQHLQPYGDHEVRMVADPENGELSEVEESLLEEIFGRFGHLSRWDIVEEAHQLPEWKNPSGGRIPIRYSDILDAGGKSKVEIRAIIGDLDASEHVHELLKAQ